MRRGNLGVAVFTTLLALGVIGFATTGLAASDEAVTEYEWSIDLDCAICHQKEFVSLGLLEAEATDETQASEEAVDADIDTDEVQAADAAESDKDAGTAKEASDSGDEAAEAEEGGMDPARLAQISGYAAMHVENMGFDCVACHVDSDELAAGHKKLNSGKEAKRLKKTVIASDSCVACHQVGQLAEASADYQGIVDSNGTIVNPHQLPEVESHADIQCVDCHKVHKGKSIEDTAMTECTSCHHAGVFECNTCH